MAEEQKQEQPRRWWSAIVKFFDDVLHISINFLDIKTKQDEHGKALNEILIRLARMEEKMDALGKKIDSLRDETNRHFNEVSERLNQTAKESYISELSKVFDSRLTSIDNRLNEIIGSLIKPR